MVTDAGRELVDPLAGRTGYLLVKLGETLNELAERALAPLGLRGKHLHVLAVAARHRLSQQELAELVGLDRTSMVAVVDELERLGLATRQRSETDRRRYRIVPTDKAAEALRRAADTLDAAEAALFGDLSPAERALLTELAARLLTKASR